MSNQLKTLSKAQLETLISDSISKYLSEDVQCKVSNLDTPAFDTEDKIGHDNKRTMFFEVNLSYQETDSV